MYTCNSYPKYDHKYKSVVDPEPVAVFGERGGGTKIAICIRILKF